MNLRSRQALCDDLLCARSGLDFAHMQTLTGHANKETGKGVAINALAWLKDGFSFVTGDAEGYLQYFEWTITRMDNKQLCPSPGMPIASVRSESACECNCMHVFVWVEWAQVVDGAVSQCRGADVRHTRHTAPRPRPGVGGADDGEPAVRLERR